MRHKVMAYVLRPCDAGTELLVFTHRHHPAAGVQVPAGTVEPGEAIEAAALRELVEESGLGPHQVRLLAKLADADEPAHHQRRHVFTFEPASPLPNRWAHTVHGAGEDAGLIFDFYWVPLTPALALAGRQERFLHLIGDRRQA